MGYGIAFIEREGSFRRCLCDWVSVQRSDVGVGRGRSQIRAMPVQARLIFGSLSSAVWKHFNPLRNPSSPLLFEK